MYRLQERMALVCVMLVAFLVRVERVEGGTMRDLYFLHSPSNTTAHRGEEAVLRCVAGPTERVEHCQWSRDGVGLGEMGHLSRYSMRKDGRGQCDLVISPVMLEDEGQYQCQVGGENVNPILSKPATLSVMVEPGQPTILEAREGDWVEVEQGDKLLLTCESHGGRPHAELHWRDGKNEVVVGHTEEQITRIGNSKAFKTVSKLRFNPLQPMTVTCNSESDAFPVKVSRALHVQLRKKVEEEVVMLRTGENIHLTCSEGSGRFKWLLNDREVAGETGGSLEIEDFTPDYDNSVLKCLEEKFGGESRILKIVRLRHTIEPEHTSEDVVTDQPVVSARTNKKPVFVCVSETDDINEPPYVWVEGRLEKNMLTADSEGRKYKCRLVPGGMRKVKQMEKKLKKISKDLKRFSKTLSRFTAPVDNT